jgi:hypothetical protein
VKLSRAPLCVRDIVLNIPPLPWVPAPAPTSLLLRPTLLEGLVAGDGRRLTEAAEVVVGMRRIGAERRTGRRKPDRPNQSDFASLGTPAGYTGESDDAKHKRRAGRHSEAHAHVWESS